MLTLRLTCPAELAATGRPANTASYFCPDTASTTSPCYRVNTTQANYASHKANCQGMGGALVTYQTAEVGGPDQQGQVQHSWCMPPEPDWSPTI
jgi:hypothetical protein